MNTTESLPITQHRNSILYAIERFQVTILVGSTGIGKSTAIPQFLWQSGWTRNGRMIGITQPRRIAVTSIAQRVADEMHVQLGDTVGYAVRFDHKFNKATTKIKFVTDGLLFREIMVDPLLTCYNVIMIDEAHERSVYSDLLLGLLKLVMMHRKDLRIIVSSATLDAEFFLAYFSDQKPQIKANLISLDSPMFPLDIHYLKSPCQDYVEQTVVTVLAIHKREPPGDILVFLTGREEIEMVVMQLNDRASLGQYLSVHPLHAGLSLHDQTAIFKPSPHTSRKVVVATNIAESSLTVPNIVYVVDCGFVKLRYFDPPTGRDSLRIVPTSHASANQRAGRAGRHRAGYVYRLYPPTMLDKMPRNTDPELSRTSLLTPLLQLQSMGIRHIGAFPFPTAPHPDLMAYSVDLLQLVGALSDAGTISELGRRVAELPLDPLLSVLLLKSREFGCVREILAIVCMLSVDGVFSIANGRDPANFKQVEFAVEEGDHLTYLNVYLGFKSNNQQSAWCRKHKINYTAVSNAAKIYSQLVKYLSKYGIDPELSCHGDSDIIRKCIVSAFFSQAAAAQPDGSYRLLRDGSTAWIHPMSALFERAPPYLVYHSMVETNRIYLFQNTAVDHKWLKEASPSYYEYQPVQKRM